MSFLITLITIGYINLSSASLDILKNDFSASLVGLSSSKAAVEEAIYAINYNPAGLSFSQKAEFYATLSNGFDNASYSYFAFGSQIGKKVFSDIAYPHIAASFYLSDLGDIKLRTLDDYGNITEKNINAEKDYILSLGYAEKISQQTVYISPSVKSKFISAAGISLKYLNSKLLERYSASSLAFDAGYLGKLEDIGLNFGISLSNTFGRIKYISESYKLPVILRIGLSYSRPTIMESNATLCLEYDSYITDKKNSLKAGIDYTIKNSFSFRTGYKFLDDNKGLSLGISIYALNFSLDIGTTFSSVYKYTFFSIGYKIPANEAEGSIKQKSPQLNKFKEKKAKDKTNTSIPSKGNTIIVF
ncbi:MAG: hypothetical protein ACP5PA_04000 [Elusimicrobiales bacterium]